MNLAEMRPGNRRAFDLILQRLRNGERTTSIVKPTRYGKRDLIITSAWQAVEDNIISGAIVFNPASQATRQFFKEKKLLQTIMRYDMPHRDVMAGVRQLSSFSEYQPFSNGEFLLAANIQLCLHYNVEEAVELIKAEYYRTRKPLVIFIDECQFLSDKKRWGYFFQRMQEAGALLVLLTATPYREDAEAIPGFRYTQINEDDERRYFVYDVGDGIHNQVDVWDGVRTLSRLDADDVTTFREAWDAQPIVLCKLDRETVTVNIDGKPLRELNAADTRKCLGKIVRDERFLDPAIRIVLNKLVTVQTIDPRCKAMIVSGSDQPNDRRDNAHAEGIRRLLTEIAPTIIGRQIKVRIITMKSDLEDDSLARLMEEFLESDEDIVLVKQAGTIGLDDWRIKVLGYFTPVRSVAAMIQGWMRPATPEGGLQIAHLVMPEDLFSTAVWNKLVVEEGGEAKLSEMSGWAPENFVDSYLKKKEELSQPDLAFAPGGISGFDDSRGNIGSLEFYEEATRIFQQLPRIAEVYTKAEVAVVLKQSGHLPTGEPSPTTWGLEQQLNTLYRQINESADEKTTLLMMRQVGHYDRDLYETIRTKIFTTAYRMVNLQINIKLRQVKNLQTLSRIKTVIDNVNEIPEV